MAFRSFLRSAVWTCSVSACGPTIDTGDEAEGGAVTGDEATSRASMTSGPSATEGREASSESDDPSLPDTPLPPAVCDDIPISMPIAELGRARIERGDGGTARFRLSKHDFECGGSFHYPECGGTWNVTIGIPPEAQAVGIYDLGDFTLGYTDAPQMEEPNCTGSSTGGGPGRGTMEILAWEDDCVAVRLTGVELVASFDLDGETVASVCS